MSNMLLKHQQLSKKEPILRHLEGISVPAFVPQSNPAAVCAPSVQNSQLNLHVLVALPTPAFKSIDSHELLF